MTRQLHWWLLTGAALCVAVWWVFLRTVTPLDFDVFATAGRAVSHGHNPYPRPGSPFVWSGSAFVYPWLSAWLFAPLSSLSLHAGSVIMAAASFAAVAGGVYSLVGARIDAFALVLLSAPTLDGLQMGTINAFLFLGVCLAWRWRDEPVLGGIATGVIVALKVFVWPLALWLLLTRRWRTTGWAVASAVVLMGVGWIAGPIGPFSYATLLGQLSSHEVVQAAGLQGELVRGGLDSTLAQAIGIVAGLALVVLGSRRSTELGFAAAVVASLIASPVVWQHYYLLCAAPLLLVPAGPALYLAFGWLSVSARTTYGIAWWPITAVAAVVLATLASWQAWRHRAAIATWRRKALTPRVLVVSAVIGALAIAFVVSAWANSRLSGLGVAVVPVLASLAIGVALRRPARTEPTRDALTPV